MNDYLVEHRQDEDMFVINLANNLQAFIRYRRLEPLAADAQVDFYKTYVPDEYRAQGLAALLVEAAFAWADAEQLEIKASCWYVHKKLTARAALETPASGPS